MGKIFYTTFQDNRKEIGTHLYYARVAQQGETYDLEKMAKHIMEHGSIWTEDVVRAVLMKYKNCILEMLCESKKVKIDGIGTLSIQLHSTGAESEEEFTVTDNVTGAHIRFRPEGAKGQNITSKQLLKQVTLEKAKFYKA
jgi:predicted histone-like DNA-binding protein